MRNSSKTYLIVSLTHLVLTITWVALLQQPNSEAEYVIFETLIGAQFGYWLFSTSFHLILDYYERKRNDNMVLISWGFILFGALGFGLMGLVELIKAAIDFSDAAAIRTSIPILWAYGFAQIGIREISGEERNSIRLENRRKQKGV